jgi:putative ABC transport system substrate-binding protein
MNGTATEAALQSYVAAFVQALRQAGWIEGQDLRVDVRWNAGDAALARLYAAQLIGLQPDVILASSTTNLTVVREATSTIPVVFTQVSDPVAQGFVASLTRPNGHLTGFGAYEFSIGGKLLDLLKEIVPGLARVAVMFNPDTSPQSKFFMRSIEAAAQSLGVQAMAVRVHATGDIEPAIENIARQQNGDLILTTDTFTSLRQHLIIDTANRHRLPSIATTIDFVKNGRLMNYSYNLLSMTPNQTYEWIKDLNFSADALHQIKNPCLRMPSCQMGGMSMPVSARSEIPVVVLGIQVMGLHEPHQMHGVQAAGEPAIRLIDVIADRLGACDARIADLNSAAAMFFVGHQIRHISRLRGCRRACTLPQQRCEDRFDCRIHARKIGRTISLEDAIKPDGIRKDRLVTWNHCPKAQHFENVTRQKSAVHPSAYS